MNIAGTEYNVASKSFDIFVSGCNRKCPGCFNPEAQDFNFGEPFDDITIIWKLCQHDSMIKSIRFMGGDPLQQKDILSLWMFVGSLKRNFPDKTLVLYTGADKKNIPDWCFALFDEIKYGPYIQELKCDNPLYGSSNQIYIVKGGDGNWTELQ